MKKNRSFTNPLILLTIFLGLTGCAHYNAIALSNLSPEIMQSSGSTEQVQISSKAFTKADCKKYLDRDIISKGYQPVQISIRNNSDNSYFFSTNRISLPIARAEEVAQKVHTSTVGRATGYGVGALFVWPLVIPAIIDGIKSSNANEALDNDFAYKVAKDQVLLPHSYLNTLIFVPRESFFNKFSVTLLDQDTQEMQILNTVAN